MIFTALTAAVPRWTRGDGGKLRGREKDSPTRAAVGIAGAFVGQSSSVVEQWFCNSGRTFGLVFPCEDATGLASARPKIGLGPNSEMGWPRKGAKRAQPSCCQPAAPARNHPGPSQFDLGFFVCFGPFRGSTAKFGLSEVTAAISTVTTSGAPPRQVAIANRRHGCKG